MEGTSTGSYNLVNTMWAVAYCWQAGFSTGFHKCPLTYLFTGVMGALVQVR